MHSPSQVLLPRGLIFLASVWLIASWLLSIGLRTPVQPSSASYTPGVRMMLLCIAIGLMIGWPLLRLSQRAVRHPAAQTLLDLLVLLALVQVVIWPLRLVTPWSPWRVAAVAATLAGWSTLAGAVIASAVGSERAGVRMLAMLACLGMVLLGPCLLWLSIITGPTGLELVNLSPLLAIDTLTGPGGAPPRAEQWRWISLLGVAALAAWLTLLTFSRRPAVSTGDWRPKEIA